jgi:ATP-dependent helicase IRC3
MTTDMHPPDSSQTPFRLRPYQEQACRAIFSAYKSGAHRQLICMATGLGKTILVGALAARSAWGPDRRLFGFMHREELIRQALDKLGRMNPARSLDYEKSAHHADAKADMILASVQTLVRGAGKRLAGFPPEAFSKIWIDEVHHAPAKSYIHVLKHFRLYDNPGTPKLLLGTTATPERLDKLGYDRLFDDVVFRYGLREGMEDGWLALLKCMRVETAVDLSSVRIRAGEFVERDLARAVDREKRNRLCLRMYADHARRKRNLVFCVDKTHARHVAALFEEAGVPVACVVDDTPPDQRRDALQRFHEGALEVLVNVTVLTEGIDVPGVEAIHLMRPTCSTGLLLQMIGRGTRKAPGKNHCMIFDYADDFEGKNLAGIGQIFGLAQKFDFKGRDVLEQVRQIEKVENELGGLPMDEPESVEALRAALERLDPLQFYGRPPRQIEAFSDFWWSARGEDRYKLYWRNKSREQLEALGDQAEWARRQLAVLGEKGLFDTAEQIVVAVNQLGQWEVSHGTGRGAEAWQWERLHLEVNISGAMRRAEQWVREERAFLVRLFSRSAPWNYEPATQAQLEALLRKGYPRERLYSKRGRPLLTKGQATALITKPFSDLIAGFKKLPG